MSTICATCSHSASQHLTGPCWAWVNEAECGCETYVPREVKTVARNTTVVGHRHPKTAKDAAAAAKPKSGTIRRLIYDLCGTPSGATDDEVEQSLHRSHQTCSAARNSLMKDGLVVDSGRRRMTRSGQPATVWQTPEALRG